jgi:predicted phage tail protein
MIRIKYIPNIIDDAGRVEKSLIFEEGKSIKSYIDECGFTLAGMRVIVNGKCVYKKNQSGDSQASAENKEIDLLDSSLAYGDAIIITAEINDPITLATIGAALWAAATGAAGLGLAMGTIGIALANVSLASWVAFAGLMLTLGTGLHSFFSRPKTPSFGGSGTGMDEGATYGWDGIMSQMDVGIPIALIYGTHKIGGNIINSFLWNDGDKNYLNILLGLCEGEVEDISDVRVNDNPIDNYDNVVTYKRYGSNDQEVIANFADINRYSALLSITLMQNSSYTYTMVNNDAKAFEVHFVLPSLYSMDPSSGAMGTWSVSYKIEYRLTEVGGEFFSLGTMTISDKSRTQVRRIYRHNGLDAGGYDIRITRTSADTDQHHIGDLVLNYINEIATDDLAYPNTALLGLKVLATDQLSGATPSVTAVVTGKKIKCPDVRGVGGVYVPYDDYYWDPAYDDGNGSFRLFSNDAVLSWDGVSYVTEYCANPVWVLYDIISSKRYGLGEYINTANIDLNNFAQEALYCDEKVSDGAEGYEKRFRADVVIDGTVRALDLIHQIAASFRCLPFYSAGTIKLKIDRPDTRVQVFGMGNIIKGSYGESWKGIKDTHNLIEVQYMDKDKDYTQELQAIADESALISGEQLRSKRLRVYCTRTSQAIREARYALWFSKYIKRTVTFKAGIDSIACQVGDLIGFSHDVPQIGFSGRVKTGSTTTKVVMDRSVTIVAGNTYKITVRHLDDTIEERTVSATPGTYTELNVTVAYTQAPAAYAVYAFGEENKTVKDYRVLAISHEHNGEATIMAIEYNASVYDETGSVIPTNNYSALSSEIPDVTNLSLTENTVGGKITLDVWWQNPDITDYYINQFSKVKIYLSDDDGVSWQFVAESLGHNYEIQKDFIVGSTYKVAVVSVSSSMLQNAVTESPQASIVISGASSVPSDVENFSATFPSILKLTWDPNPEGNIAGYEIRTEDANFFSGAAPIFRGLATNFSFTPSARSGIDYYIKAYNSYGVYSENSAMVSPENAAPAAPANVTGLSILTYGTLKWSELSDVDITGYQIYKSETNAWLGEEVHQSTVTGPSGTVSGNEPRDGVVMTGSTISTLIDPALAGFGNDFFNGDKIMITSGLNEGQEVIVADYDSDTGTLTLAEELANVPTVGDYFTIFDIGYYRVRGVDGFGVGAFSDTVALTFEGISENLLGDKIIGARKMYAGEIIAYSAQIRDGVIQNGHIINLSVDKLLGGFLTAQDVVLKDGGSIQSEDYAQGTAGFRIFNKGIYLFGDDSAVDADLVLIAGFKLRSQYIVTANSTLHNEDTEWEASGYSIDNVTINDEDISLDAGDTSGYYISPPIDINNAELGVMQWNEVIDVVGTVNQATSKTYSAGYSGGSLVSNASNCFNENTSNTASWVDGTTKWGQFAYAQVNLGSALVIKKARAYVKGYARTWYIQYSTDGTTWTTVGSSSSINSYVYFTFEPVAAAFWRFRSNVYANGSDNTIPYDIQLFLDKSGNVTIQTRTADNSSMTDPSDWSTEELSNPAGSQITSDTDQYLQYRVNFTRDTSAQGDVKVTFVKANYDIVVSKNANKVGGYEVSATPAANKLLPLDGDGVLPASVIPTTALITNTGSTTSADVTLQDFCFAPNYYGKLYSIAAGEYTFYEMRATVAAQATSVADYKHRCYLQGVQTSYSASYTNLGAASYNTRYRYVTASDPERWLFVEWDIANNKISAVWECGDHLTPYADPTLDFELPFPEREGFVTVLCDNQIYNDFTFKEISLGMITDRIHEQYSIDFKSAEKKKNLQREARYIDLFDDLKGETRKTIDRNHDTLAAHIPATESHIIKVKSNIITKLPANVEYRSLVRL